MCTVQGRNRDGAGDAEPMDGQAQGSPLLTVFLRERECLPSASASSVWIRPTVFLRERECLRRIAAGMGMNSADAEDVLQDVSLQVLKYGNRFEQENVMMRWLVRTTVNHCLSEHRRRFRRKASRILRRRPDLGRVLDEGGGTVGLSEELEIIRRTLIELDPSLLLIVVLRYFCDLDSKAIAEIAEMNASTVRGRLREARLILATKLSQRAIEP